MCVCVFVICAPGNRNHLTKVTDGVWSYWHFAVTEALTQSLLWLNVEANFSTNTQNYTTAVKYFKVAFNEGYFCSF